MKQVHLIISGQVQGIGYRAWVKNLANKRGIVGWVRNRGDGAVEVVIEGAPKSLQAFIQILKKGPVLAEVRGIDAIWSRVTQKFTSFEIHK